jgi:hypothetical protein
VPENTFVDLPITSNTWIQQADELNIPYAKVTLSVPPSCSSSVMSAQLYIDGVQMIGEQRATVAGGSSVSFQFGFMTPAGTQDGPLVFFEPGAATSHTVTAQGRTTCTGGTVDVSMDVVAIG